jgi:hypothetical protein
MPHQFYLVTQVEFHRERGSLTERKAIQNV